MKVQLLIAIIVIVTWLVLMAIGLHILLKYRKILEYEKHLEDTGFFDTDITTTLERLQDRHT